MVKANNIAKSLCIIGMIICAICYADACVKIGRKK